MKSKLKVKIVFDPKGKDLTTIVQEYLLFYLKLNHE